MSTSEPTDKRLTEVYRLLSKQRKAKTGSSWWPHETGFEVMVGAILTQSAAWRNVEKAIENLKVKGKLKPKEIRRLNETELEALVRPSGYYKAKSRKLKALCEFLSTEFQDDIEKMKAKDADNLRPRLLEIWGVGEETADSILLYALKKPSFVVDAYTKRLFNRIGVLGGGESYGQIKSLFEDNLVGGADLYMDYHALIVEHCKNFCLKKPRENLCNECVLKALCVN